MNIESLELVICPSCRSVLKLKENIKQEKTELITAIVECDCSQYPILEGILILRESLIDLGILSLIEQGKTKEATIRCLWSDYFENLNSYRLPVHSKLSFILEKLLVKLGKYQLNRKCEQLYKSYTDQEVHFYDLIMGKSLYATYTKHRFSSESFWSLYPFIPLLSQKNERILDLSCGAGHTSFVLEKYVQPKQLFSAEFSFRNLYLTKKYFASKAECICLDANYALPFKAGVFSSILILDAFHYIRSCYTSLPKEMKRIVSSTGVLLLLHVHNSQVSNLGAGIQGLTPEKLTRLFSDNDHKTRVMPERKVLEDFLYNDKLSLTNQCNQEELNSSNASILLYAPEELAQKNYSNIQQDSFKIKDNLIINPIYKIEKKGNVVHLTRSSGHHVLGDHLPISEEYLPKEIQIVPTRLKGRHVEISDTETLKNLQKKFVVINVPEKYAR